MLEGLGARALAVRSPADLDQVVALVVPGGESTAMSVLLGSSGLAGPVARRLAAGMPALGTCAGMVLLASEVLDGRPDQICFRSIDISVRRNAFGRQRDSFETDLELEGLESPVHAVFIRAPVVERVGKGVEVLASVGTEQGQRPVACRQGNVLVTSFHPELVGEVRVHQLFLRQCGLAVAGLPGHR